MDLELEALANAMLRHLVGSTDLPLPAGLRETPARFARAMRELTAGYCEDPSDHLAKTFEADGYDEIIALSGIHFFSLCERHLLPFSGTAGVAYIPRQGGRMADLGKLARVVEGYSRRLQLQERLARQIADAMQERLRPLGVAVVIRARHLCLESRGARKPGTVMTTSVMLGAFRDRSEARAEVLRLLTGSGSGA